MSSSEQEPGPRGSPQLPQGPGSPLNEAAVLLPPLTANLESCWFSFLLSHFGHFGVFDPSTIASKRCSQSPQMYSNIGILNQILRLRSGFRLRPLALANASLTPASRLKLKLTNNIIRSEHC